MPPSKEVVWASNEIVDGKALCCLNQCKRLENAKWVMFMTRLGSTMLFTVWECEWEKNVLSEVPGTRQQFWEPCWHCRCFSLWELNILPLTWQLQSPLVQFLVVGSLSFPALLPHVHMHVHIFTWEKPMLMVFFLVISKQAVTPSISRGASLLPYCTPGALQGNPWCVDLQGLRQLFSGERLWTLAFGMHETLVYAGTLSS